MNIWKGIDYIWFLGESYHKREKGPGDGETLLMWCWYFDAVLPLFSFAYRLDWGWLFNLAVVLVLLAVPFVFCRIRYKKQRKKEIEEVFRDKHPGRSLLLVWLSIIAIACVEGVLMVHFGFWKINL